MTTVEKAKQYFENNKETKELFATSDGFLFLLKKDAQNHAQTLEDSVVEYYNSSDLLDESDDSEGANQGDPTDILQLSKKKLEKAITTIEDIGLLEALILQEENEQNRSEVLSLLADRIETLKNQA
ncbi:hypothetical protein [Capnocytophaga gingivalis]|uniref:hypothetical protein n=1 Tax=Capnocytophaga gingivalis TaxID=1017 RepID=UPI00206CDA59|nr:hypothetical protein [Capnocytophaga gingivalis]DAK54608.1 MAG TPA: hypothetical protein [Caudoviricetes sp.]